MQRTIMELPKRYEAVARLGASSSTGDPEGEITETGHLPPDPPPLPTGEIRQRPPIYSAIKIKGERAYRKARRGESFQMPERIVTVSRFEQLWRTSKGTPSGAHPEAHTLKGTPSGAQAGKHPFGHRQAGEGERAGYLIECSSGTYVRSLIADLGDAYCLELRRTAIGPFELARASAPPPRGQLWRDPPLLSIEHALAEAERFQTRVRALARAQRPSVT